jgi:hypothetical protein
MLYCIRVDMRVPQDLAQEQLDHQDAHLLARRSRRAHLSAQVEKDLQKLHRPRAWDSGTYSGED